jgi:hypothetical protein
MFSLKAMQSRRILKLGFALLLAVILPLRGYAAMANCVPDAESGRAVATHGVHLSHCAYGAGALHPHGCGNDCCGAAIALTPARWIVPHTSPLGISAGIIWPPPLLALDRLDRPPRLLG